MMARDFIYIDSDKVKEILKDSLDMGEGDLSGNKLGLGSKIIGVVVLNEKYAFPNIGGVWATVAEHTERSWEFFSPKIKAIQILQSNTETDAKNFDVEIRDGYGNFWEGAALAIANGAWAYVYRLNTDEYALYSAAGQLGFDFDNGGCNFKGKTKVTIRAESAAGTAQAITTWISYESGHIGRVL